MRCQFGCGRKAITQFTSSGKWCCSNSCNSCPAMKARQSSTRVGINPWQHIPHPRGATGKTPWNKGLTSSDERIRASADKAMRTKLRHPARKGFCNGSKHSKQTKKLLSQVTGGWRPGSGSGIKGRYAGIWCDSSWELAFLLYCLHHGFEVRRATSSFPYLWCEKIHKYTPDFQIRKTGCVKWLYVEVKGYESPQWEAKRAAFPHRLLLVNRSRMINCVLPVVKQLHGERFTSLYI